MDNLLKTISKLVFVVILINFANSIRASELAIPLDTTKNNKNLKLSALPILFYLPETKLGFGVAGIALFNVKNVGGTKPSQVEFGIAYTLRKQILIFFPFELYTAGDKLRYFGEASYYKYFYNYHGKGIDSKLSDLESYEVSYPRINLSFTRKISKYWYAGAQYKFDDFNIMNIKEDGLLASNNVVGKDGGIVSSVGFDLLYDTRDNLFSPSKGIFINFKSTVDNKIIGATFNYMRGEVDIRYFKSVAPKHVFAFNFFNGFTTGNVPFFQEFFLSNGTKLRGFDDRRYQDRIMAVLQAEYRFPIFKRLSGVVFSGLGTVSENYGDLLKNPYRNSSGIGLRFILNKEEKTTLRLDYARNFEGGNVYVTVKEAF